jgi:hypothetical protein
MSTIRPWFVRHGTSQCEVANVGRKFRELRLIELVAAIVQNPDTGVREFTPIAL